MDPKRCIYCQERDAVSDSKKNKGTEHAFARSLGGNLRIPYVCQVCNNSFASIDEALAQHSLISFARVCETNPSALRTKIGHEHLLYNPACNIWLEVSIENEFQPKLLPQMHLMPHDNSGPNSTRFITGSFEDHSKLVRAISKLVDDNSLDTIHIKIDNNGKCTTPRIVLYREQSLFVRAASEEQAHDLLSVLRGKWNQLREKLEKEISERTAPIQEIQNPDVSMTIVLKPNDINRAIVKNIFNILAYEKGAEFAHRPEFDPIRKYIINKKESSINSTSEAGFSIDKRFVLGESFSQIPILPANMHFIAIGYEKQDQEIMAIAILYRQHKFVVKLARIALEKEFSLAYEFSYDRTENRKLSDLELKKRLKEIEGGVII